MSSDIAISVRNLTKTYRLFAHPGDRIKQAATFGLRKYHKEFTALKDVSFDIKKGETVGIIGRNGSGKSTLLQLICGILKPTAGTVQANGRISALLELGAGFNPEFTGRENVYFQGALQGITKNKIDERFSEIATFADIGEFIEQPVRVYSSGMYVRLAFATAIHSDPDLLLIDEALAVGDAEFQTKCFQKILSLRNAGCSVIIVSHDQGRLIKILDRAILLDKGRIATAGDPVNVVETYRQLLLGGHSTKPVAGQMMSNLGLPNQKWNDQFHTNKSAQRYGNGSAEIIEAGIFDSKSNPSQILIRGQDCNLKIRVAHYMSIEKPVIAFSITDIYGTALCGTSSSMQPPPLPPAVNGDIVEYAFYYKINLNPGTYLINIGYSSQDLDSEVRCDLRVGYMQFEVIATTERAGYFDPRSEIHWRKE